MTPESNEFIELAKASGWSQRRLTEELMTTQATVSRYLNGVTPVPPGTLRLFKMVLASERPELLVVADAPRGYPPHRDEFSELKDQLVDLKRADPAAYKSAKLVIGTMHRAATANSAEAVALGAASELDVAGVPHPPATPLPKRAAPAPNAHKPPPAAPAPPRRGARRAAPKPAPTAPAS